MAVENAETRRLNLGQLLYNNEHGAELLQEKLNKKLFLNSLAPFSTKFALMQGCSRNIRIYKYPIFYFTPLIFLIFIFY